MQAPLSFFSQHQLPTALDLPPSGCVYIVAFEAMLAHFDAVVRKLTVTYCFCFLSLRWLVPSRSKEWSLDLTTAPSANECLLTMLAVSASFSFFGAAMMRQREFRMKTAEGS